MAVLQSMTPIKTTERDVLLRVDGVSRVYGRGERSFTAVENINLSVHVGEFVAVRGPSGCGKSTLLRMITGLIAPTQGSIYYRNQPVRGVNPYSTMVFQSFALYPWLTVLDNVALALEARGVPRDQREEKAIHLIDMVGLDGFERAYPRELSGGMRQKVGIARALAIEPELLCLDEPFSALDVLSAEALRGEVMELWQGGKLPIKAILMVSHNIEEAISMADRVVVMGKEPGHIAAEYVVNIPHPRNRKTPGFESLIDRIYAAIAGHPTADPATMKTKQGELPTRILPQASVEAMAGLLEFLNMGQNRRDIYKLDDELGLEMETLVEIIEMCEMLGFVKVTSGDVELTTLGQIFAEATILTRKEIFANRARRLPMMQWIMEMLRATPDGVLPWRVFYTALKPDLPDEMATRQIDIAIDWGRYAELIDYDDRDEALKLEEHRAGVGA